MTWGLRKEITYDVDANGCHVCTSHKRVGGYPRLKRGGKSLTMSRYLYEKANGPIPEGMVIRHKCDNRACINVDHLELGTYADNYRDMVERGREPSRSHPKYPDEIVQEIRNSTKPASYFTKKYGVSLSYTSLIRRGKNRI